MPQNRILCLSNLDVRAISVKAIVGHLGGSVSYFSSTIYYTNTPLFGTQIFKKNKKFFRER
jgi:hypothetical protein